MVSIQVPSTIRVSFYSGDNTVKAPFIKREGPFGSFIKKAGDLKFSLLEDSTGNRLFIHAKSEIEERAALAQLQQLFLGLSRGYRQRLRLVGVGYRAAIKSTALATSSHSPKESEPANALALKVGFSHEVQYPLTSNILVQRGGVKQTTPTLNENPIKLEVSRLEGHSKATLLRLQGSDSVRVHQLASNIRRIQRPDPYKGKGIHFDGEVIRLKKGKREG
jgi:large subunit ribosomal protein L6